MLVFLFIQIGPKFLVEKHKIWKVGSVKREELLQSTAL